MIDIDWTLYALLINFLVLVFLLNMVLFRPIRKALKERIYFWIKYEMPRGGPEGNW